LRSAPLGSFVGPSLSNGPGWSGFGHRPRSRHPSRDLNARVDTKLVEDVRYVALDRAFGDKQLGGRLGVRRAVRDKPGDFHLALRQEGRRLRRLLCPRARLGQRLPARECNDIGKGECGPAGIGRLVSRGAKSGPCLGSDAIMLHERRLSVHPRNRGPDRVRATEESRCAVVLVVCDLDVGQDLGQGRDPGNVAEIAPDLEALARQLLRLVGPPFAKGRDREEMERTRAQPSLAQSLADPDGFVPRVDGRRCVAV